MSDKHGNLNQNFLQSRLRWVLFILCTPVALFLCGQAGWMMGGSTEDVEIRSVLSADYSPWSAASFPGLDPDILRAALNDRNVVSAGTRRALDCFLLTSGCEALSVGDLGTAETASAAEDELRIDNIVEPDLIQPDGSFLILSPGKSITLDIRTTPLLIEGVQDPDPEMLIFTEAGAYQNRYFDVSIALQPDGNWVRIYRGEDQAHGDSDKGSAYSREAEVLGSKVFSDTTLFDSLEGNIEGLVIDVDGSAAPPGTYGWVRIDINPDAPGPIGLDAVIILDE